MGLHLLIVFLLFWAGEIWAAPSSGYPFLGSVHFTPKAGPCPSKSAPPIMESKQTAEIQRLLKQLQEPSLNPLSSEECRKHHYLTYQVSNLMKQWGKTGSQNHAIIAELMEFELKETGSNESPSPDLFIICNPKGEIYAAGVIGENSNDNYLTLHLLISSPDPNQKKGGTAAMEHIMRQAILRNKSGINLSAMSEAREFYTRMGFKPRHYPSFIGTAEHYQSSLELFIDKEEILKKLEQWQKQHSLRLQTNR